MAHLYGDDKLWAYVSMVGFAEHYVLDVNDDDIAMPFYTFQRHQQLQRADKPIFSGVVLRDWQTTADASNEALQRKFAALAEMGVDYIRLECNLGSAEEIGGPAQLVNNPVCSARLSRLVEVAKICQEHEMVPLILLQVPWRESGEGSIQYFKQVRAIATLEAVCATPERCLLLTLRQCKSMSQAVESFADATKRATAWDPKRVLLETRPPLAFSAQEERDLESGARSSVGLMTGHQMFEVIKEAFHADTVADFCVAGGSTKGASPTAMEDDTQNAVRQGIRQRAREQWGYELCFWEMGAKLMLQPKVGQLWGHTPSERDAARKRFRLNAKALAEEIVAPLP